MARKNKVVVPTTAERFNAASAKAASALTVFHQAAADLEAAAEEQAQIGAEVQAEIDRLTDFREDALAAEAEALHAASKIRDLFAA